MEFWDSIREELAVPELPGTVMGLQCLKHRLMPRHRGFVDLRDLTLVLKAKDVVLDLDKKRKLAHELLEIDTIRNFRYKFLITTRAARTQPETDEILRATREDLRQELCKQRELAAKLTAERMQQETAYNALYSETRALPTEIEVANNQLAQLQRDVDKMFAEVQSYQGGMSASKRAIAAIERKEAELEDAVYRATCSVLRERKACRKAATHLEQRRAQLRKLQKVNRRRTRKMEAMAARIEDLQRAMERLREVLCETEEKTLTLCQLEEELLAVLRALMDAIDVALASRSATLAELEAERGTEREEALERQRDSLEAQLVDPTAESERLTAIRDECALRLAALRQSLLDDDAYGEAQRQGAYLDSLKTQEAEAAALLAEEKAMQEELLRQLQEARDANRERQEALEAEIEAYAARPVVPVKEPKERKEKTSGGAKKKPDGEKKKEKRLKRDEKKHERTKRKKKRKDKKRRDVADDASVEVSAEDSSDDAFDVSRFGLGMVTPDMNVARRDEPFDRRGDDSGDDGVDRDADDGYRDGGVDADVHRNISLVLDRGSDYVRRNINDAIDRASDDIHRVIGAAIDRASDDIHQDIGAVIDRASDDIHQDIGAVIDRASDDIHQDIGVAIDRVSDDIHQDVSAAIDRVSDEFHQDISDAIGSASVDARQDVSATIDYASDDIHQDIDAAIDRAIDDIHQDIDVAIDRATDDIRQDIGVAIDRAMDDIRQDTGVTIDRASDDIRQDAGVAIDRASDDIRQDAGIAIDRASDDIRQDAGVTIDRASDDIRQDIGAAIDRAVDDVRRGIDAAFDRASDGIHQDIGADIDRVSDDVGGGVDGASDTTSGDVGAVIDRASDDIHQHIDADIDRASDDIGGDVDRASGHTSGDAADIERTSDDIHQDIDADIDRASDDIGSAVDRDSDATSDVGADIDRASDDIVQYIGADIDRASDDIGSAVDRASGATSGDDSADIDRASDDISRDIDVAIDRASDDTHRDIGVAVDSGSVDVGADIDHSSDALRQHIDVAIDRSTDDIPRGIDDKRDGSVEEDTPRDVDEEINRYIDSIIDRDNRGNIVRDIDFYIGRHNEPPLRCVDDEYNELSRSVDEARAAVAAMQWALLRMPEVHHQVMASLQSRLEELQVSPPLLEAAIEERRKCALVWGIVAYIQQRVHGPKMHQLLRRIIETKKVMECDQKTNASLVRAVWRLKAHANPSESLRSAIEGANRQTLKQMKEAAWQRREISQKTIDVLAKLDVVSAANHPIETKTAEMLQDMSGLRSFLAYLVRCVPKYIAKYCRMRRVADAQCERYIQMIAEERLASRHFYCSFQDLIETSLERMEQLRVIIRSYRTEMEVHQLLEVDILGHEDELEDSDDQTPLGDFGKAPLLGRGDVGAKSTTAREARRKRPKAAAGVRKATEARQDHVGAGTSVPGVGLAGWGRGVSRSGSRQRRVGRAQVCPRYNTYLGLGLTPSPSLQAAAVPSDFRMEATASQTLQRLEMGEDREAAQLARLQLLKSTSPHWQCLFPLKPSRLPPLPPTPRRKARPPRHEIARPKSASLDDTDSATLCTVVEEEEETTEEVGTEEDTTQKEKESKPGFVDYTKDQRNRKSHQLFFRSRHSSQSRPQKTSFTIDTSQLPECGSDSTGKQLNDLSMESVEITESQ